MLALLRSGGAVRILTEEDSTPVEPVCASVGSIVRRCTFRGLNHGDNVLVDHRMYAMLNGKTATFMNVAENPETGNVWVEVWASHKPGQGRMHFVPLEAIYLPLSSRLATQEVIDSYHRQLTTQGDEHDARRGGDDVVGSGDPVAWSGEGGSECADDEGSPDDGWAELDDRPGADHEDEQEG